MIGCWHSPVFRDIIPKRYDLTILFVEYRINDEIFSSEIWGFKQTGTPLQTLLNHSCTQQRFPGTPRTYSSRLLTLMNIVETKISHFRVSLVIFWHGSFSEAFLRASWLVTWGLSDRRRSVRESETFKRCSTRWSVIPLNFVWFEILVFLEARA